MTIEVIAVPDPIVVDIIGGDERSLGINTDLVIKVKYARGHGARPAGPARD